MKKILGLALCLMIAGCVKPMQPMQAAAEACKESGGKLSNYRDTAHGNEFKCVYPQ